MTRNFWDNEQLDYLERRINDCISRRDKFIAKCDRRPFVIHHGRSWTYANKTHWVNSRSSFKYEGEAIRKAARLRLNGVPIYGIRKWSASDRKWTDINI